MKQDSDDSFNTMQNINVTINSYAGPGSSIVIEVFASVRGEDQEIQVTGLHSELESGLDSI